MKRILAMLIAFAMVLTVSVVPAMATDSVPDTVVTGMISSAEIGGSGSTPPSVIAKWEQLDRTVFGNSEDGDLNHSTPGTEINPPCVYQATKDIEYYSVVTDLNAGVGNIKQVWTVVYHPQDCWENGSEKYQFELLPVTMTDLEAEAFVNLAIAEGLVTLGDGFTAEEVAYQVRQGLAKVYHHTESIYYEQPAGDYRVVANAINYQDVQDSLVNYFHYVPATCFALDNMNVSFGNVPIGPTGKQIGGDATFLLNDGKMTVRTLGNTNMEMIVAMDDMEFGKYSDGTWKVGFDGRVTDLVDTLEFAPQIEKGAGILSPDVVLPGLALHSADTKIDFSIHVLIADTGVYDGNLVMTSQIGDMMQGAPTP